jgi:hypothetical protein
MAVVLSELREIDKSHHKPEEPPQEGRMEPGLPGKNHPENRMKHSSDSRDSFIAEHLAADES